MRLDSRWPCTSRGNETKDTRARSGPRAVRIAVLLALAAVLAITYFNIEAAALKKYGRSAARRSRRAKLSGRPGDLRTGSISALSIATASSNGVPPETAPLRSIWLGPRILSAIDPDPRVHVPDTVAGFVDIPSPYNTYTMFGDLYFDFGLGGVFVASLLSGILFGWMHRRVVDDPSLVNAWTSSVGIVILFGGVAGFRLFWLDTATWLIAGGAIMWWIGAGVDSHRQRHGRKTLPGQVQLIDQRASDAVTAQLMGLREQGRLG